MAIGKRDLKQFDVWMEPLTVDSVRYYLPVDTTWHNDFGERSKVRDHYNSATLYMSRKDNSDYKLDVEVRAYDEGIAFRYFFPEHPAAIFHKVTEDLTDYTFPDNTMAWSEQWAQARFDKGPVDSISIPVERALTLKTSDGKWVALLDADTDDWCLTKYRARKGHKNTLESVMYSPVDIVTYYSTPWKIIMTADSPAQLMENNDIVLNLNPAPNQDFSCGYDYTMMPRNIAPDGKEWNCRKATCDEWCAGFWPGVLCLLRKESHECLSGPSSGGLCTLLGF